MAARGVPRARSDGRPEEGAPARSRGGRASPTRPDDLLAQGGARLDLAEALVHAGRTADAAVLVEEALVVLDRKGATLPASNARERFADLLAERVERAAAPRGG